MSKFKSIPKIAVVLAILMIGAVFLLACDNNKYHDEYDDPTVNRTLKISALHGRQATPWMESTNLTGAASDGYKSTLNGKTYFADSLKPFWEDVQTKQNVTFTNGTKELGDVNSANDNFNMWKTANFPEMHIMNVSPNNVMQTSDRFVDMSKHWDIMPNFKKFLDENPFIYSQIKTENNEVFFTPYFDGIDEFEKAFMIRADWVKALLDGPVDATIDHNETAHAMSSVNYTPFLPNGINRDYKITNPEYVSNKDVSPTLTIHFESGTNIIERQNNIITDSSILPANQGKELIQQFRTYIDEAYKTQAGTTGSSYFSSTNRSDLFIGADAAYNTDELVALMRLIRINSGYLLGDKSPLRPDSTANWNGGAIVPFFNRTSGNDRNRDVFRLAMIFGARGLDSRFDQYYWDDNGQIMDGLQSQNTMKALARVNQLYRENLILQDYDINDGKTVTNNATAGLVGIGTGATEHRTRLLQNGMGAMMFDYTQTTLVFAEKDLSTNYAANNNPNFEFRPILPPFTSWKNEGNIRTGSDKDGINGTILTAAQVNSADGMSRFIEGTRGMNTGSAGAVPKQSDQPSDRLNANQKRALKILDSFWSEDTDLDGVKILNSFGPKEWLAKEPNGEVQTFLYSGKSWPVLDSKVKQEMISLANGSYTNYYRYYVGATAPLGYIKEQAMEVQLTYGFATTQAEADKLGDATVKVGNIWMNRGVANILTAMGDFDNLNDPARTVDYAALVDEAATNGDGAIPKTNRAMHNTVPYTSGERQQMNTEYIDLAQNYSTESNVQINLINNIIKGEENYPIANEDAIIAHMNRIQELDSSSGKPITGAQTYRAWFRLQLIRDVYNRAIRIGGPSAAPAIPEYKWW